MKKALLKLVSNAQHGLAHILPNRCLMCHQRVDEGAGLCRQCLNSGLYCGPVCLGCGKLLSIMSPFCGQCLAAKVTLKVTAPCSYHQGLGEWIAQIKYQRQFSALDCLSLALIKRLNELEQAGFIVMPQVLIPVPLHTKRLRQRGFNQAWVIANVLSEHLNIPVNDTALIRQLHTKPQAGLDGKQRRANLQGAFHLSEGLAVQRIALVDDVVTTGTTAKEIAKLFEQQHIHVQVWCLARAEAPNIN